ncbi:MAG: adenylate kinase [Candidatus Azobacteroides sp.]|nr:adenylate kinase [Candidatus Azobacteroides sp.]
MLNVIIFGPPGSGKGTQSELIIAKYGLYHISTGEILRQEIKKQTELGAVADEYIKTGQLIPDELIIKILADVLDANLGAKGFIFDGFPRTIAQGKALDQLLSEKNTSIIAVLNLAVDEEELLNRLIKRGEESGRTDDDPVVIQKRLEVYRNQTEPLKEFYKKKGKLFTIKGNNSIEDVFEKIAEVLDRLSFQAK